MASITETTSIRGRGCAGRWAQSQPRAGVWRTFRLECGGECWGAVEKGIR